VTLSKFCTLHEPEENFAPEYSGFYLPKEDDWTENFQVTLFIFDISMTMQIWLVCRPNHGSVYRLTTLRCVRRQPQVFSHSMPSSYIEAMPLSDMQYYFSVSFKASTWSRAQTASGSRFLWWLISYPVWFETSQHSPQRPTQVGTFNSRLTIAWWSHPSFGNTTRTYSKLASWHLNGNTVRAAHPPVWIKTCRPCTVPGGPNLSTYIPYYFELVGEMPRPSIADSNL
jgi:hypothetical protein